MFEDIELGPFVAVKDISPEKMKEHHENMLDEGLFTVAVAIGDNNECVMAFKNDENFKTMGVFINFYYIKQYDA